jgi:hypothetical protein
MRVRPKFTFQIPISSPYPNEILPDINDYFGEIQKLCLSFLMSHFSPAGTELAVQIRYFSLSSEA